jgi:hypothetical protein
VIVKKKRNRPGFLREKGISDFPFGENFLSASSWGRGIPTLNWCPPGDGLVHHGGHSFVATSPMSNGDAITTIGAQGTIVNGVRSRTVAAESGNAVLGDRIDSILLGGSGRAVSGQAAAAQCCSAQEQ